MASRPKQLAAKSSRKDAREIARTALRRILEPLVDFILFSELSVHEAVKVLREVIVRNVAAQQLAVTRKINISGIFASTGIPRAEISRILKIPSTSKAYRSPVQHPTSRVLTAWNQNPRFMNVAGRKPAELRIYGKGATFERLVRSCSRGTPVRAVLDELQRIGAIEITSPQTVRMKALVVGEHRYRSQSIKDFGGRASELLSTLLKYIRHPEKPGFVANISVKEISAAQMALVRKELTVRSQQFLSNLEKTLMQSTIAKPRSSKNLKTKSVSVAVLADESDGNISSAKPIVLKRTNLRRKI